MDFIHATDQGLKTFVQKMEGIYQRSFRDKETLVEEEEGFHADPAVTNRRGAYLIAFRPPQSYRSKAASMSGAIVEDHFLATYYGQEEIHVTLSSYQDQDNFSPDQPILDKMALGIEEAMKVFPLDLRCEVIFKEVLFNQTTIVLAGYPDLGFLSATNTIIAACHKKGLVLNPPWGAHSTISRLCTDYPPRLVRPTLNRLARNYGVLGYAPMESIDVGWCQVTGAKFEFHVAKRFPI